MPERARGGMRAMSELGERVEVIRNGEGFVSIDGKRWFAPYGDAEWAWWIEVAPNGEELHGLWEFWEDEGVVACICG